MFVRYKIVDPDIQMGRETQRRVEFGLQNLLKCFGVFVVCLQLS